MILNIMNPNQIEEIKKTVSKGLLNEALKKMHTLSLGDLHEEVIALQSTLANLERAERVGTISTSEKTLDQNKITNSILLILKEFSDKNKAEDNFNGNSQKEDKIKASPLSSVGFRILGLLGLTIFLVALCKILDTSANDSPLKELPPENTSVKSPKVDIHSDISAIMPNEKKEISKDKEEKVLNYSKINKNKLIISEKSSKVFYNIDDGNYLTVKFLSHKLGKEALIKVPVTETLLSLKNSIVRNYDLKNMLLREERQGLRSGGKEQWSIFINNKHY